MTRCPNPNEARSPCDESVSRRHGRARLLAPTLASLFVLCGCGERQASVAEYEEVQILPHQEAVNPHAMHPPTMPPVAMPNVAMPPVAPSQSGDAGREATRWTTPDGWQERAGQGMRLATFLADTEHGQTECSVVVLSGSAGGLPANVQRWIGQLKLDVPSPEDLNAFLSRQTAFTTAGGDSGVLVDLTSYLEGAETSAESMQVGVVTRGGQTVFIKMMGPVGALRAERENLLGLCRSLT